MHRRLFVLLVALFAVLVGAPPALAADKDVAPEPPPAGVQASCFSANCSGLDPQAAGCAADGVTLAEFTDFGVRYELRRSNTCYAAWTRITAGGSSCANTTWGQIRTYGSTLIYGQQVCPGTSWTRMISFQYQVQACVSYVWVTGTPAHCTGLY